MPVSLAVNSNPYSFQDPYSKINNQENIDLFLQKQIEDKDSNLNVLVQSQDTNIFDKLNIPFTKRYSGLYSMNINLNQLNQITPYVQRIYSNRDYQMQLDNSLDLINLNQANQNDLNGQGVKVAILDTGINEEHEFVKGKIIGGMHFITNSREDGNGHGTHIAGIIAGENNEIKGVAPRASLLNVKVLNSRGSGDSASISDGILYALNPDGNDQTDDKVDIISISIGGKTNIQDEVINQAILNAINQGVVVIVAAGNCNQANDCEGFQGVTIPGSFEPVITVGSVDKQLNHPDFSAGNQYQNYIKPDVVAPGVGILSSDLIGYERKSGTSMSTPFVTGLAALMIQNGIQGHFNIKRELENRAIDLGQAGKDIEFGSGLISLNNNIPIEEIEEEIIEEPIEEVDEDVEIEPIEAPLEAQHGDHVRRAGTINFDQVYYYEYDDDFTYTFHLITPEDQGIISFSLYDITNNDDLDLYVYDFQNRLVCSSTNGGNRNDVCRLDKNNDGQWGYYVQVRTTSLSGQTANARLRVKFDEIHEPEPEQDCNDFEDTFGSCDDRNDGDRRRNGDDIQECEDQIVLGEILCWERISELGDNDFCEYFGCDLGEYDCDRGFNECNDGLVCKASINGGSEGCCREDEAWDFQQRSCVGVCEISSVSWNTNSVVEGTQVTGRVRGNDACANQRVTYEIYEADACIHEFEGQENNDLDFEAQRGFCDDLITQGSFNLNNNGDYDLDWNSIYVEDVAGNPEYLFEITHDDQEYRSGELQVSQRQRTCAQIGNNQGSCNNEGSFRRLNNNVEECNDLERDTLCWQIISRLGDDDYCNDLACNEGDYDCDFDDECSGNLVCKGEIGGSDDGCCQANQEWDSQNNQCFIPCIDNDNDGYGTNNADSCENQGVDCNDNNANINPGALEICNQVDDNCRNGADENFKLENDENNCGACGNQCNENQDCQNSQCINENQCGDGICSDREFCAQDCIEVVGITSASDQVNAGEEVQIGVTFRNNGDFIVDTIAEVGIVPNEWRGVMFNAQESTDRAECCQGNNFYDARNLRLAANGVQEEITFTFNAPTPNSMDACPSQGEEALPAWSNNGFTIVAGAFNQCGAGYFSQTTSNIQVINEQCPNGLDGSSQECSCNQNQDCQNGFICNQEQELGVCIQAPIVQECNIPDGSSQDCDCDSNSECPNNFYCDLGQGFDACVQEQAVNECNNVGQMYCDQNNVFRCEEGIRHNEKILVEACTQREICNQNNNQAECISNEDYDLIIEYSSSSTTINKQRGDSILIKITGIAPNLEFDQNFFSGNCNAMSCTLQVRDDAPLDTTNIVLGQISQTIKIIQNPHILYITNVDQLEKRYGDNQGVNALLKKTYEKASANRGVVYDLDREIDNHPFSFPFSRYFEKLIPQLDNNRNEYVIAASNFVHSKCDGCKEVLLVGDDYVVPSAVRESYLDESELGYYTDFSFTKRKYDEISDLDEMFDGDTKNYFVVPDEDQTTLEFEESLQTLRNTLMAQFLGAGDRGIIRASQFNDQEFANHFNAIDSIGTEKINIFVIGTQDTNRIVSFFPIVSELSESVTIDSNPWDREDGGLLIIKSMDPNFINAMANMIDSRAYEYYHASSLVQTQMNVEDCTNIGFIPVADVVGDVCEMVNDCYFESEWGWCTFDTVMVFAPVVSAKWGKVIIKAFDIGAPGIRLVYKLGADKAANLLSPMLKYSDNVFRKGVILLDKIPVDKIKAKFVEKTFRLVKKLGINSDAMRVIENNLDLKGSDEVLSEIINGVDDISNLRGHLYNFQSAQDLKNVYPNNAIHLEKKFNEISWNDNRVDLSTRNVEFKPDIIVSHNNQIIAYEVKSVFKGKLTLQNWMDAEKKSGVNRFRRQLEKLNEAKRLGVNNGGVSDIKIIVTGGLDNVDESVFNYIEQRGLDIGRADFIDGPALINIGE
jgi:subtilisin family serine protease